MKQQEEKFFYLKVFGEFIYFIVFFPFWWYSKGLLKLIYRLLDLLKDKEKKLGFFIWIKNIFTPMYGQRNFWGVIVSFIMRIVNIILRGIILFFYFCFYFFILFLWIILPWFVLLGIYWQLI